jgi:hypothetical protein
VCEALLSVLGGVVLGGVVLGRVMIHPPTMRYALLV